MDNFSEEKIEFADNREAYALLGGRDEFLRLLQESFSCKFFSRGLLLEISGEEKETEQAALCVRELQYLYRQGARITTHELRYAVKLVKRGEVTDLHSLFGEALFTSGRGKTIRAKTLGQKKYLETIKQNAVTFGAGPAGTGKTYLAVVMAASSLRSREVQKIILTRPAVEAGERLGFLPGDMQEKVDPYLRPLYDALEDILGSETYQKLLAKNVIEIAPLAYMRGRTLDNAFIILDEAQNTTISQMKMFLTRLGFNSKMVITGDPGQVDLPRGTVSGLKDALEVLEGVEGVGIVSLSASDVIRHEVVSRIVRAYDKREAQKTQEKQGEEYGHKRS